MYVRIILVRFMLQGEFGFGCRMATLKLKKSCSLDWPYVLFVFCLFVILVIPVLVFRG